MERKAAPTNVRAQPVMACLSPDRFIALVSSPTRTFDSHDRHVRGAYCEAPPK
jgi:hypothetical protein